MKNGNNNILTTYDMSRKKINDIEYKLSSNNKDYYDNFLKEIACDYDCVSIIETMYFDSFVLLNFKKRLDIITEEERKIYSELFRSFNTDKASLIISFYTNENRRNNLIEISSKYRKYSVLSKAKMSYLLDDIFINIFLKLNFRIKQELNLYDFNISYIKNYICTNIENEDLINQLESYFKFLFLYNVKKYNCLINYIRFKIGSPNINDYSLIKKDEISDFIKIVTSNNKQPKIFEITKK